MADEESTAYDLQDEFESKAKSFGRGKYGRILKMAHTPSKEEYKKTVYVTGIGIIVIGALGFAIWWVMSVLPMYFRGKIMALLSCENAIRKVHAGASAEWPLSVVSDGSEVKISFSITTGPDSDAPDWDVMLYDSSGAEIWTNGRNAKDIVLDTPGKGEKMLRMGVICPKGARYGDTVDVTVTASDGSEDSIGFKAVATQSIMILKTQIDQEKVVAQALFDKTKSGSGEKDIYAILCPAGLRGYVFVEGMNTDRLREMTREIRKARNFIDGETSIEEIEPYLVPVSAVVGIVEGDIVELVDGPFKGEKARVQKIDPAKEEITVELVEAMIPIPVTVKGDSVRVIEKER